MPVNLCSHRIVPPSSKAERGKSSNVNESMGSARAKPNGRRPNPLAKSRRTRFRSLDQVSMSDKQWPSSPQTAPAPTRSFPSAGVSAARLPTSEQRAYKKSHLACAKMRSSSVRRNPQSDVRPFPHKRSLEAKPLHSFAVQGVRQTFVTPAQAPSY